MKNGKIEVLHITSNLSVRSGVASVVMNYYRYLNREKVRFSALYFDERPDTYLDELQALGGTAYCLPRKNLLNEWRQFRAAHRGQFDILHNHEAFLSVLLPRTKETLGVRRIVSHAHATKFADTPVKNVRNAIFAYPTRYLSDALLACSRDAGEAIFGGQFAKKGTVLRNAIRLDPFLYAPERETLYRRRLGLEGKFVIGHVGNFSPQKNHDFLLDVFFETQKHQKNAVLLLVGDGSLRSEIERKARRFGVFDKLLMAGTVHDVYHYLQAMNVFLFPSRFEGLGIALVEAQAAGLPCVYSDVIPAEADVFPERNTALSLKSSPAQWAEAVLAAGQRPKVSDRSKLQEAGYDIVTESGKLLQFYESLLS